MKTKKIISGTIGSKSPDHKTLWSIQPVSVWHKLIKKRILTVNTSYIEANSKTAYDWIVSKMKDRISGYSGFYPWWAYEARPYIKFHTEEEGFYVLLELSMGLERFLLSSYGGWHSVLDNCFYSYTIVETIGDEDLLISQEEITKSWDAILDVEYLRSYDTIQATFEFLNMDDVYRYTLFEVSSN